MARTLTFHDLAAAAGVHVETLRAHRRAGAPAAPPDRRGLAKWVRAYEAWRTERAATRATPPPGGGDNRTQGEQTWAARRTKVLALSALFDLQVKQRKYVLREAVDDQRTRQVQLVTLRLAAIARKMGPVLYEAASPEFITTTLEGEFRTLCEAFANDDADDAGSEEADTPDAAEPDLAADVDDATA